MLYRKKYIFFSLSISKDFCAAGGNHLIDLKVLSNTVLRDSTNINFSLVPVNLAEANCPRDRVHAHDCLPITILSGAAASVCACAGVFSHVMMTPHFIYSHERLFFCYRDDKTSGIVISGISRVPVLSRWGSFEDALFFSLRMIISSRPPCPSSSFVLNWLIWLAFH